MMYKRFLNHLLFSNKCKIRSDKVDVLPGLYMSHSAIKTNIVRSVSTWIRLSMPRWLIQIDTFRLMWNICFGNHYSIHLSPWSGSIHYAEAILLVFSRNGSYNVFFYVNTYVIATMIAWLM